MNPSTSAFRWSKYWVVPIAFAGLSWVISCYGPSMRLPKFLQSLEEEAAEKIQQLQEQVAQLEASWSKYWVVPIVFAGLSWVIGCHGPSMRLPESLRSPEEEEAAGEIRQLQKQVAQLKVFWSKYWVVPIVFASLSWVIWCYRPSMRLPESLRSLFSKSKEEEERERAREARIEEAAEEIRQLEERIAQLEASSKTLSQSLQRAQEDRNTIQQSLRREEDAKSKALAQNQRLTADIDAVRRQLDTKDVELKNLRSKLTALPDARTRKRNGAQVCLSKADALSGTEVIALVNALNVEILQTSTFISDSFDFARKPKHVDEIKEASTRISELMGVALAHLLNTVTHSEEPFLVQIALQGATVEFARWIIMTWDFDGLQAEQPLAEIYDNIRESESQAVGGWWRALTRAHAQKVALQQTDLHATMVAHISNTLVIIIVAAGIANSHEEAYRTFTHKFGERISNIVKMASRLNKAMGEEVTSADLWPTSVTCGEKFDRATMENFEAHGESSDGKTIMCTTALGLQRSEKVVQGNVVRFKTATLLKPKVALETMAAAELQRDEA